MKGYAGKLLFVDLSSGEMEERPLKEEDAKNFLGGPALGAKILYDEMPANADVFGPESMVGFVSGPLNGAKALYGGRYTVVSKSPVTGGWNDSNSGGYFGPMLKQAGFDGVFVRGVAEKPVYIFIDEGKAEILDASDLWGLTTLAVEEKLRQRHGEKINAALIGPGGENLSNYAAVMNDGHRAAGRGGTGAVIGSKKLKALVVKGSLDIPIADNDAVIEANKAVTEWMKGPAAQLVGGFGTYGTGVGYVASVLSGDASVKNWGGAGVEDYPEEAAMPVGSLGIDQYKTKKYNCSNCPMGCGAFMDIPSDRWDLSHTPRTEYETQGAFGSQMLNSDNESVCRCNDICNEYGLDTISTGATIAWAMECFEEGVLSKEELDGIELKWGDGNAIVAMAEKIAKNEGVGAVLAKGSQAAAEHFGKGHEYLVVASGIEEPQHDGRLAYGLTRTYQYDPTPGRHVKGGLGMAPSGPDFDYATTGVPDMMGVVAQEICNSSGYCMFGMMASPPDAIMKLVMAVTGFTYTEQEIAALGRRMFNMRHAFNLREGKRRKDFTLSKRFYESDPPAYGPLAGVKVDHERLADNFFEAMGWDKDMVPAKETLETLGGLDAVVRDLYGA